MTKSKLQNHMKTKTLLPLLALCFAITPIHAADDTPVPPEVQKLAETLVAAIKSGDDAALLACWHTPEALAKIKQAEDAAEDVAESKTTSAEDSAKTAEREVKRRNDDNKTSTERAARLRTFLAKHFGEVSALTLTSVELDEDNDAPADQPAYDDVDIFVRTADGAAVKIGVDDLMKIDGAWKFKGHLDDDISIKLPEVK